MNADGTRTYIKSWVSYTNGHFISFQVAFNLLQGHDDEEGDDAHNTTE
jgi:hypothetical protein